MDREAELRAAGQLAGDALAGTVGVAGGMHEAIAHTVERHLPAPARPVAGASGTIAAGVYALVAGAHRMASAAAAAALARLPARDPGVPSAGPVGRAVLPLVNGLWGDTVAARAPALEVPMAVRVGRQDLPVDAAALAGAFPGASGQLAVFVHGLAESDESWWRSRLAPGERAEQGAPRQSYGDLLRADLGLTPIHLRYNTGLRVADNGRALAALLDAVVAAWPVEVTRIVLVGHSMGGLVSRSACHYGELDGLAWVGLVTDVVALGTPHLGAPLEKGVHVAHWLLDARPETQPLGRVLGARSPGVRDLRHGAVVDDDSPDPLPADLLQDPTTDVPLLLHARYWVLSSTLTADPRHPLGVLAGDGLVRTGSAAGAGGRRRIPFDPELSAHLGGVGHLSLLNHPEVYERLRMWLDTPPPGVPAPHQPPAQEPPG